MSAITRGLIVMEAHGSDLIVQATAADVATFSLHEAVDMLAEQGWNVVPNRHYDAGMTRYVDPVHGCVLVTRCGCEKRMPLNRPFPEVVRICLTRLPWTREPILDDTRYEVRVFARTGRLVEGYAEYREEDR